MRKRRIALEQIDDAIEVSYGLSPVQEGMLFHALAAPGSGVDIEQIVVDLMERLHPLTFQTAWNAILERHHVLRSSFDWTTEPTAQQVLRQAKVSVETQDWTRVPASEQGLRTESYLREARLQAFDLRRPLLMRLALFFLDSERSRFVWTFHHILLDGRAFAIVLQEVFHCYDAVLAGRSVALPLCRPYREYIDWLRHVDLSGAEKFWRQRLDGFTAPTRMPKDLAVGSEAEGSGRYGKRFLTLPRDLTAALRDFVKSEGLTLNVLLHGVWGLLLARYSGEADVVFGVTKTTRGFSIPNPDTVVGLFLPTFPVRVKVEPGVRVVDWPRKLRSDWIALRPFEHTPLVKIRACSAIKEGLPLFHSLFLLENRSFDSSLKRCGGRWENCSFRLLEQTNYELTLIAYDDDTLRLKIEFNRCHLGVAAVDRMFGHLQTLLQGIIAGGSFAKRCRNPHRIRAASDSCGLERN
jgi:hypothetical protein